ncbi:unnamed protein product, partial [Ectocarpus sp. 8 AP-2014]
CPSTKGGHLEIGEEWPRCAEREVFEETGLEVRRPTRGGVCYEIASAALTG